VRVDEPAAATNCCVPDSIFWPCSAKNNVRLRMKFNTDIEAKRVEKKLTIMLEKYSGDTVKKLQDACNLCGGFNGDSEIFLVTAEVLDALKQYYDTRGEEERLALQVSLDAGPRPPTDGPLLLKTVIDAGRERLAALSTPTNSTFTVMYICMMLSLARLTNHDDPRLGTTVDGMLQPLIEKLQLKENLKVVAEKQVNWETAALLMWPEEDSSAQKQHNNVLQEVALLLKLLPTAAAAEMIDFGVKNVIEYVIDKTAKEKQAAAATDSLLPVAAQIAGPRSMRRSDGGVFGGGSGGGGGRPPLYDASRSSRSSDGASFAPRPSGGAPPARRPLRVSRSSGGFIPSPSAAAARGFGGGAAAALVPGVSAQLPAAVCRAASSLKPRSSAGASFIPAVRFAMTHI
jgi:hypothetical protein